MSSSIKVSRTSSPPSKRISIQISIRVRLRSVEIIEPEMSPDFSPWGGTGGGGTGGGGTGGGGWGHPQGDMHMVAARLDCQKHHGWDQVGQFLPWLHGQA